MAVTCAREAGIVEAAARGWTGPADAALAAHAAECPDCLEVMAAAEAMRIACAREVAAARVPASAVVWWRLERRLREDRARTARRMLTVAHGVAGAVVAGVAVAAGEVLLPVVRPAVAGWTKTAAALAAVPDWLTLAPGWTAPIAVTAAVLLVLAPTAAYLITREP